MHYAYKPLERLRDGLHVLKWCIGLMPALLTSRSLWYKMLSSKIFLLKGKNRGGKNLVTLKNPLCSFIETAGRLQSSLYTNSFYQMNAFSLPNVLQNSNRRISENHWPKN